MDKDNKRLKVQGSRLKVWDLNLELLTLNPIAIGFEP